MVAMVTGTWNGSRF